MFSAFKRLAGKSEGMACSSPRPAHQLMPTNLQRKFAKGVQYNSKNFTVLFNSFSVYF
jgi:hypothetical protein